MIEVESRAAAADEVVAGAPVWLERAVIGPNLCPFAKAVQGRKQIRYAVTAAETADEDPAEVFGRNIETPCRLAMTAGVGCGLPRTRKSEVRHVTIEADLP